MHVTKKLAQGLGTAVLGLALVAGLAAAGLAPAEAQARDEKGKPPLAKLKEVLEKLVNEGKLSAEQSATIITRITDVADKLEEKRDRKENEPRKDEHKPRIDVHKLLGGSLSVAAAHLGGDVKALGEQLRSGKSLADVAATDAAPETTRESLIAAITAHANVTIDELTAAGTLTGPQAAGIRAQLGQAAAKIVDAKHDRKVAPGRSKRP